MLPDDLRALREDVFQMLDRYGCIQMDWDRGLILMRVLRQLEGDAYDLQHSLSRARGDHLPPVREAGNVVLLRPRSRPKGRGPTSPQTAA